MFGVLALVLGALGIAFGLRAVSRSSTAPRPRLSQTTRENVEAWRQVAARQIEGRANVSLSLVLAVIARESAGNPNATGGLDEVGLMQVRQPALTDYLREVDDAEVNELSDLEAAPANIRVGAWFLNRKIEEMGSVFHGLRAYNAGTVGATNNPTRGAEYARWIVEVAKPEFATLVA